MLDFYCFTSSNTHQQQKTQTDEQQRMKQPCRQLPCHGHQLYCRSVLSANDSECFSGDLRSIHGSRSREKAVKNGVVKKSGVSCGTAYPRRHETPFLDWNAEFRFAESRFSQPLYQ